MKRLLLLLLPLLAGCGAEPTAEAPPPAPSIRFEREPERVDVFFGDAPFTSFHYEEKWDKPFLYPILTASGKTLSRGYPVQERPGEHNDHVWHRGIWFGHGEINGQDFWRELGRDKTSRLIVDGEPAAEGDALTIVLSMVTPANEKIGTIVQTYAFSQSSDIRWIDARMDVRADQGVPLTFGDTEDGGFGFRLSDAFREDMGGVVRNAEGLRGTDNVWGKASPWVDYSAVVNGAPAGVAIFDHPENLRHPTRWHARGYSLNAANPFGISDFTGDAKADGSHTVPAGETLTLRYRVAIYEGAPDLDRLNRMPER